jgi:hypothetical protein
VLTPGFGEGAQVVGLAESCLRMTHDEEPHARKDTTGAVGTSL